MCYKSHTASSKNKGGRPTLYSKNLAENVLSKIRDGLSETKIGQMPGMPTVRTLGLWKHKYPDFLAATIEARRASADLYNDRRMELVDELIEKTRAHEEEAVSFPKGVVDGYKVAMQELAREAAIRDDHRFSDRQKVIAEVNSGSVGDGMDAVYAKMREAVEAHKDAGK